MKMHCWVLLGSLLAACGGTSARPPDDPPPTRAIDYGQLPRLRFNQLAMRLDLPLFWASDVDTDQAIDPEEVRAVLFYPTEGHWVADGRFTEEFDRAYLAIVEESRAPAPDDERRRLVIQELDSAAPTLVETDLRELPEAHRLFAQKMLVAAGLIDRLYATQSGMIAMAARAGEMDVASRSLFRRNWGPECAGASTESNPACSALEGAPSQPVDIYPADLQTSDEFCAQIETNPQSQALLTPFTAVRRVEGNLVAQPYHEAYAELTAAVTAVLREALEVMTDPEEDALRAYLSAAAQAFSDDNWDPANEAWAAMNARNSRWYLRIGPDEVYWDPCNHKAGYHLTLALIDRSSLEWQDRLTPLQQRMEQSLDDLVRPYRARDVSFHMPDFIGIVLNAGDDRSPFGATIGQSLPNWGPVAEEGRGRTVAMSNLYSDEDSQRFRREQAASVLSAETMAIYTGDAQASLMSTILHEATHNLGPAHEYRYRNQTASEAFGGGLASMLEELKAQSGALFYLSMLREEGIIDAEAERETYLDSIVWAFGHISRGMYTPTGQRKAYSQLAAVQVGFLMDRGVLRWDADAPAANGTDRGAFTIDFDAFPAAARELMELVVTIKATNARARAEEIATRYVDGEIVPQAIIAERYQRLPRASFLYAIHL
jgi:hypothetical protein